MSLQRTKPLRKKRKGSLRPEADRLFSLAIRARDGRCMAAEAFPQFPCGGNLQTMHLISRRYSSIRWNQANALAGCAAHHVWLTHHPLEHSTWAEEQVGPIAWEQLKRHALHGEPMKPADVIQRYRGAA